MKNKIIKILLLFAAVAMSLNSYQLLQPNIKVNKCMFRLFHNEAIVTYEGITDNTMVCDLAAFSNIINNLILDGYVVSREVCSENSVDISLSKDGIKLRIEYMKDGNFLSLANPYEKSYIPMTYINEDVLQSTGQGGLN